MSNYTFSAGMLGFRPQGSNQTPDILGLLTDININDAQEKLLVYGAKRFAIDSFDGKATIEGTAKFQSWGSRTRAALYGSAAAVSVGSKIGIQDEAGTIPGTPYKITVANGATFFENLGVRDVNTGVVMTRVASAPATGQYSLNDVTGEYTFAAADTAHAVRLSYAYTSASLGRTTRITNTLMGQSTQFVLSAWNNYGTGKNYGMWFPATVWDKLGTSMKVGELAGLDTSFKILGDASDIVGDWYSMD